MASGHLLDHDGPPAEAVERPKGNALGGEGPGEQVPRKRIRFKSKVSGLQHKSNQTRDVFTIQEEKDHESWRPFHQQQKLNRQREQSQLAKQVVDQEVMAARISIPVFEEDVFHASTDATAFLGRETVEVSYSKLTDEQATEMDDAKSRELAEWIQDAAISKVRESQQVQSPYS